MPQSRKSLSHRLLWLALLLSLGIGALTVRTLWTLRNDEWNYALQANANLVGTLSRSLEWTLDAVDQSLLSVASELERVKDLSSTAQLRQQVRFEGLMRLQGLGDVLVLNAQGDIILDSGFSEPRKANFADRDYFRAFKDGRHEGLFIGKPVPSRVSQLNSLPMARAYHTPDGAFAGVVLSAVRLSYFNELFASVNLGDNSGVNLFRADGIIVSRFPYGDLDVGKSIAGSANMLRFQKENQGSFVGLSEFDGVERSYSFTRVGRFPLILNVAQARSTIESKWTRSAWGLGMFTLLLMLSCMALAVLFSRELQRRQAISARLHRAERDMSTILHSIPSVVGSWDANLYNRFGNQAHEIWFGVPLEKLRGMHMSEMLGSKRFGYTEPLLRKALEGEPQVFETTLTDKQGMARHVIVSYTPERDGEQVLGLFIQLTDITDRKHMEDQLFEEKELMRLTLQSIGDAVVCCNAAGHVTYLNPVAQRLTGWQGFDAAGRDVDDVIRLLPSDAEVELDSPLRTAMQNDRPMAATRGVVEHRATHQRFDVELSASPIADRHGHVTGAVAVLRDVTQAVAMAARMARLAHYDALTDLPNRVLLQDRAQQAIAQAQRDGKHVGVLYLDLDGFKQVNDAMGHDVGDQLLVQWAQRLQAAVRQTDTVCRQGGDEFVLLLPGIGNAQQATVVARKIMAQCEAPFMLQGVAVPMGLSGGISLYPEHGRDLDELTRHADAAMYAAKQAGRNQVRLYEGTGQPPRLVVQQAALA